MVACVPPLPMGLQITRLSCTTYYFNELSLHTSTIIAKISPGEFFYTFLFPRQIWQCKFGVTLAGAGYPEELDKNWWNWTAESFTLCTDYLEENGIQVTCTHTLALCSYILASYNFVYDCNDRYIYSQWHVVSLLSYFLSCVLPKFSMFVIKGPYLSR